MLKKIIQNCRESERMRTSSPFTSGTNKNKSINARKYSNTGVLERSTEYSYLIGLGQGKWRCRELSWIYTIFIKILFLDYHDWQTILITMTVVKSVNCLNYICNKIKESRQEWMSCERTAKPRRTEGTSEPVESKWALELIMFFSTPLSPILYILNLLYQQRGTRIWVTTNKMCSKKNVRSDIHLRFKI